MKAFFITLGVAIILACAGWGAAQFVWDYQYNKDVGSYFKLSDQASDTDLKLKYLVQYRDKLVEKNIPNDFHPALIGKRPDNAWGNRIDVLNTLVTRLQEATKLDRKSFEYQQSISQITGQEYEAFDDVYYQDAVLWHAYGAWYFLGWIALVGGLAGAVLSFSIATAI